MQQQVIKSKRNCNFSAVTNSKYIHRHTKQISLEAMGLSVQRGATYAETAMGPQAVPSETCQSFATMSDSLNYASLKQNGTNFLSL